MSVRAVMKNKLLWKSSIWVHYCMPVWKMWSIQQPEVREDANFYWHYYTDRQWWFNYDRTIWHLLTCGLCGVHWKRRGLLTFTCATIIDSKFQEYVSSFRHFHAWVPNQIYCSSTRKKEEKKMFMKIFNVFFETVRPFHFFSNSEKALDCVWSFRQFAKNSLP